MRLALLAGGWLYAGAIIWLSLAPTLPEASGAVPDKLAHFGAYALLMLWFCVLYRRAGTRAAFGALWIAMGVALEFAQRETGTRSFELADMAANALGVAAGAAAAFILPRGAAAAERETPSAGR